MSTGTENSPGNSQDKGARRNCLLRDQGHGGQETLERGFVASFPLWLNYLLSEFLRVLSRDEIPPANEDRIHLGDVEKS